MPKHGHRYKEYTHLFEIIGLSSQLCTMPPTLGKKPLPSKENTLFKELLSLYETRQLKKALKTADQILKKFPDHGGVFLWRNHVLKCETLTSEIAPRDPMYEGARADSYGSP